MDSFSILAAEHSEMNAWLGEHPAVLGLIFTAIGALLIYYGIDGMKSGRTTGKWGVEMTGGTAQFVSLIRLIGGVGACLFGFYKMIIG